MTKPLIQHITKVPNSPRELGFQYNEWKPFQKEAIEELIEARQSGTNVLFLDAPTSFGKSLIGLSLINILKSRSIIVTSTKYLSSQYQRDYTNLAQIRGRANYPCILPEVPEGTTAANAPCQEKGFVCPVARISPYNLAKAMAVASDAVVTNYDYLLREANFVGSLVRPLRGIIIADEAHTIERHVTSFLEINFSNKTMSDLNLADWVPDYDLDDTQKWLSWAQSLETLIKLQISNIKEDPEANEEELTLRRFLRNLIRFTDSTPDQWIMDRRNNGTLYAKPVWIKGHFNDVIRKHAQTILMASATFVSTSDIARYMGIEEPHKTVSYGSNIPLQDRPLYYSPMFHMSKKQEKQEFSPADVAHTIDNLIAAYYPLPALIHTVNYTLTKQITQLSRYRRFMISHNEENREVIYQEYMDSKGFKVLISPSLGLGVDFPHKQGLQIICKLPFPSLGDRQVLARKNQDPSWYNWATASALEQAYGRGSRVPGHICDTYIIDSNYGWFRNSNKHMFSSWFIRAEENVPIDMVIDFAKRRGEFIRGYRSQHPATPYLEIA